MELNEVLMPPKPKQRQTIKDIAERAGVARGTIYNVQRNPEGSTLATLRRVLGAMGYNLIIRLEKIEAKEVVEA